MKKLTSIATALVLAGTLAACSSDDAEETGVTTPPSDSSPTSSASPSDPAPTTEPATPTPTEGSGDRNFETADWVNPGVEMAYPSTKDWAQQGTPVIVKSISAEEHDDFDRITLELDANEQPGWLVKYDDLRNVLEVELVGVPNAGDSGQSERVPVSGSDDLDEVEEIYTDGPTEGRFRVLLEVDDDDDRNDDAPKFRVRYLESPSTLTIDVQDD